MNLTTRNMTVSDSASEERSHSSTERRAAPRYQISGSVDCPFVLPVVEDFGPARIKDISTEGVGLLLQKPLESGELMAIGLRNSITGECRTHLVQIVHCTALLGGVYQIGGEFLTPLAYEELRTYIF